MTNKKKIIISVDPGRVNWAYSILNEKGKILKFGIWKKTINQLKDVSEYNTDLSKFVSKVEKFFHTYKDCEYILVYERMIPRGFNMKLNTAEIVNMCIGMFLGHSKHKELIPLTAATWKNFCKKVNIDIHTKTAPVHVCDSIRMGLYFLIKQDKIDVKEAKSIVKTFDSKDHGWKLKKNIWRNLNGK